MKVRVIRMSVLSTLVLGSTVLAFADDQTRIYPADKSQTQDRSGITRAVQYGKGTGVTRNERVLRGNAYREQTAQDSASLKQDSSTRPNWGDHAFRK